MNRALPLIVLICAGASWGATQPLAKIAVSEGYRHFGILFWQMTLGSAVLGVICLIRGRLPSFRPSDLRVYIIIALVGSVFPGVSSYTAAIYLPSGILSILLSSVPMLAFPIALALGLEAFRLRRFFGLLLGFAGVALLIGPKASLPDPSMTFWVFVALISSAFYALEGNVVARWGTNGLGPLRVLCGASLVGAFITLPLSIWTGQFIDPRGVWTGPDWAIVGASVLHAGSYVSYVWLIGRAGPIFAAQVAYLVTLFGVVWAMLLLGETYSTYIWAALCLMLVGVALVQPKRKLPLVVPAQAGQTPLK